MTPSPQATHFAHLPLAFCPLICYDMSRKPPPTAPAAESLPKILRCIPHPPQAPPVTLLPRGVSQKGTPPAAMIKRPVCRRTRQRNSSKEDYHVKFHQPHPYPYHTRHSYRHHPGDDLHPPRLHQNHGSGDRPSCTFPSSSARPLPAPPAAWCWVQCLVSPASFSASA